MRGGSPFITKENRMKTRLAPLVVALGFAALPAMSATVDYIEVQTPPPALVVETTPAPVSGQLWIPGYYDYKDGQYAWVSGHFEPQREGYVYVAPRYDNGKYYVSRWDEEEHGGTRNKIRNAKNKLKEKVTGRSTDD
jgi:hypothetical protein